MSIWGRSTPARPRPRPPKKGVGGGQSHRNIVIHISTGYSQLIHSLSTGYPQRTAASYQIDTSSPCCAARAKAVRRCRPQAMIMPTLHNLPYATCTLALRAQLLDCIRLSYPHFIHRRAKSYPHSIHRLIALCIPMHRCCAAIRTGSGHRGTARC